MRLIDADALKAKIEAAGEDGTIANYCKKVLANCLDSDAPTVAAIPIDWLIDKFAEAEKAIYYCKGDWRRNAEIMAACRTVMALWEEAR